MQRKSPGSELRGACGLLDRHFRRSSDFSAIIAALPPGGSCGASRIGVGRAPRHHATLLFIARLDSRVRRTYDGTLVFHHLRRFLGGDRKRMNYGQVGLVHRETSFHTPRDSRSNNSVDS